MNRIIIADDHSIIRHGLHKILSEQKYYKIIGDACDYQELALKTAELDFDILIMDIKMPHGNIIDFVGQFKISHPTKGILILSIYPEEQYAKRLYELGIDGYLTKESLPSQLMEALNRISQGKKYISPVFAEKLAMQSFEASEGEKAHEILSNREYQVLTMISNGLSISEIARELSISSKTVSTLRHRILKKLNLKNNYDLIKYTLTHDF